MKKDNLVILLILFVFGVWVMLSDIPNKSELQDLPESSNRVSKEEVSRIVNKHLSIIGQQQDLHEQSETAKNILTTPRIGDKIIIPNLKKRSTSFGLDADVNESNAYEDLHRYKKDLEVYKPDHEIQSELADQEYQKKYQAAFEEAYIKQFIENAKANGYEVKLNDKNEVIGVKALRRPSNQIDLKFKGSAPVK